jgi:Papain-like cysteine protease AvrRpt2
MALVQLLLDTAAEVPALEAVSTGAQTLAIDVPHQEQANWCWCAATVGVSQFFEQTFSLSQCEAAAKVLAVADACDRPSDDDVDRMFELDKSLRTFNHLGQVIQQPLAFEEVEREMRARRPVGVQILFQDRGVMHITIIRGCRRLQGDLLLLIDDPHFDESEYSYEQFKSAYRGDGQWIRSYITR